MQNALTNESDLNNKIRIENPNLTIMQYCK